MVGSRAFRVAVGTLLGVPAVLFIAYLAWQLMVQARERHYAEQRSETYVCLAGSCAGDAPPCIRDIELAEMSLAVADREDWPGRCIKLASALVDEAPSDYHRLQAKAVLERLRKWPPRLTPESGYWLRSDAPAKGWRPAVRAHPVPQLLEMPFLFLPMFLDHEYSLVTSDEAPQRAMRILFADGLRHFDGAPVPPVLCVFSEGSLLQPACASHGTNGREVADAEDSAPALLRDKAEATTYFDTGSGVTLSDDGRPLRAFAAANGTLVVLGARGLERLKDGKTVDRPLWPDAPKPAGARVVADSFTWPVGTSTTGSRVVASTGAALRGSLSFPVDESRYVRACRSTSGVWFASARGGVYSLLLRGPEGGLPPSGVTATLAAGAALGCDGQLATLTTTTPAGEIEHARCTTASCRTFRVSVAGATRDSEALPLKAERPTVLVGAMADKLLAVWQSSRGGIRFRLAEAERFAEGPDAVVYDDIEPGTDRRLVERLELFTRPAFSLLVLHVRTARPPSRSHEETIAPDLLGIHMIVILPDATFRIVEHVGPALPPPGATKE